MDLHLKLELKAAVVFLVVVTSLCSAENCQSLDGKWYNQLGSELTLRHNSDGRLEGEYRTAVERTAGSAGTGHSLIEGASPYKPGSVFGFAVMWRQGVSITAWTGQCHMCGGKEVLITSWVLRQQVWTCVDKWKSTLIGQDYFTREEQREGPREDEGTQDDNTRQLRKRDLRMMKRRDADNRSLPTCSFEGYWYNELGSEVQLQHEDNDFISGQYKTAVELKSGTSGSPHKVYGVGNKDNANTTMALFVLWPGGNSVTGWVGQCHLCGENNTIETIETTWLLRKSVPTCDDNWKATLHGQNSFTREASDNGVQKLLGIHTAGQEGEDVGYSIVDSPCSATTLTSWLSLTVCVSHLLSQFLQC